MTDHELAEAARERMSATGCSYKSALVQLVAEHIPQTREFVRLDECDVHDEAVQLRTENPALTYKQALVECSRRKRELNIKIKKYMEQD